MPLRHPTALGHRDAGRRGDGRHPSGGAIPPPLGATVPHQSQGGAAMHDPECPICRVAKASAPYRTKDRRGVAIEHPEPKP